MVLSINLSKYKTEWDEYYSNTNYTDESFEIKKEILAEFREKLRPKTVFDFGANTGVFSRIFSDESCKKASGAESEVLADEPYAGADVMAFDIDPLAVEKNYLEMETRGEKNILPLVFDIVNPTPALGFNNEERKTLKERMENIDLVLALALMHHLRITYNVPFSYQAKFFAQFSKHLIIEFVDKEDSKVQTMLLNREDVFDDYTKENFEAEFKEFYKILETRPIKGTKRTVYLMEKA